MCILGSEEPYETKKENVLIEAEPEWWMEGRGYKSKYSANVEDMGKGRKLNISYTFKK